MLRLYYRIVPVWTNADYEEFTLEQLSDEYLTNIIIHLELGGGYIEHLSVMKIRALCSEVRHRKLEICYDEESLIRTYIGRVLRNRRIHRTRTHMRHLQ